MTGRKKLRAHWRMPEVHELSDADIHDAMKKINGYLDITPADFRELYRTAWRLAMEKIAGSVTAADIMTREVVAVGRENPVMDVAKLMADRGVSGVPVLEDDGTIAGIITERDFLACLGGVGADSFMAVVEKCLAGKGCAAAPVRTKKAEDIMTAPVCTITEETLAPDIAMLFKKSSINRAPVIDDSGRLVGIVSREDLVHNSLINFNYDPLPC